MLSSPLSIATAPPFLTNLKRRNPRVETLGCDDDRGSAASEGVLWPSTPARIGSLGADACDKTLAKCTLRCQSPHRTVQIEIDDLSRPAVHDLLREHLANMFEITPAERVFALDLSRLRVPEITFWTAWEEGQLLGCGALRELTPKHGEVKSMRTPANARRRGAGRAILNTIVQSARDRGYELLSLETGSDPAFHPAQRLYTSVGFEFCGPFGEYEEDPHSVFMQMRLS